MNKAEVQQTGGFPLETDTLDFLQEAYTLFNDLGYLSGQATIISGCVQTGSNVSDGVVFYNGEIFEFRGGAIQTQVRIYQETENREFEDGSSKLVYKTRYMGFGSSGGNILWNSFTRPKSLKELTADLAAVNSVPVGAIMMWAGTIENIPAGYSLCDGTNGTPNLSGRFVVGYNPADGDYDEIGSTGGLATVTLTEAQMPRHSHAGNTGLAGGHSHTYQKSVAGRGYKTQADENPHGGYETANTSSVTGHIHAFTTDEKGGDQAHENRPPYFVIAYIQKTA